MSYPYAPQPQPPGMDSVDSLSHRYPLASSHNLDDGSAATLQTSPFLDPSEPRSFGPFTTKETYASNQQGRRPWYKRVWVWLLAILVVAAVVVVVIVFVVIKPGQHNSNSSKSSSGTSGSGSGNSDGSSPQTAITTGGDGSTVTTDDGSTFIYNNPFGGFWVSDPANPFDNSARPNSWTPPLNTSWTFGTDRIYGVNLGGLFVLEPFIAPALFQANPSAVDEWTLSEALAAQGTLQQTLEDHYSTFVTEQDVAQIAGAGLNWIRVPVPFWAIEVWADVGVDANGDHVAEPFLARTCWKYVLRLLGWARKYGLRVLIDLHTIPGSQNGFNHSGKLGSINWLNGVMGLANAERSLDYIRTLTEFISQPEYVDLIPMFGILNEPFSQTIGKDQLESFYLRAYEMVRNITGTGEGNGPMIAIHDGFSPTSTWAGFLSGADRLALDTHQYFAFDGQQNRQPVNVTADGGNGTTLGGQWPQQACGAWTSMMDSSREAFGVTVAGEFSNGFNDCGLFVIGVNVSAVFGPGCDYWEDFANWSDETKQGIKNFALASMDALGDWFFWTWKIGNSTAGSVQAPLWSYQLGLENGWMPADPREAVGACAMFGQPEPAFAGPFQPWQTGGAGAGDIAASATQDILAWPPSLLNVPTGGATALPQYTSTATPVTLPPESLPTTGVAVTASVGDGWAHTQDSGPAVTAIAGCAYPDAWDAVSSQVPLSGCLPAS